MVANLIVGCAVMTLCLAIQCVVVAILLLALLRLEKRGRIPDRLIGASVVLAVFALIMMAGTLVQAAVWAAVFLARAEFADFATALYHSLVNFATLGYGDIVMSERGRLLGALEATNGVLMFGLTTGVLYSVFSALLRRVWDAQHGVSEVNSAPR